MRKPRGWSIVAEFGCVGRGAAATDMTARAARPNCDSGAMVVSDC